MSIKATFPAGVAALTVHGLHQWDYGQRLEVSCADLTGAFEVHFSNVALKTAHKRACSVGASVAIPDVLLQQPYDILAWVCEVGEGRSRALHTLRIPITPRPKPEGLEEDIPAEEQTQFQEMMVAFNATVDYWLDGVKETNNGLKLKHWYGTQAEYDAIPVKDDLTVYVIYDDPTLSGIQTQIDGLKAGSIKAGWAHMSEYSRSDANGNEIPKTYGNFSGSWTVGTSGTSILTEAGTYQFRVPRTESDLSGGFSTLILTWDGKNVTKALVQVQCLNNNVTVVNLTISASGQIYLETWGASSTSAKMDITTPLQYRKVC